MDAWLADPMKSRTKAARADCDGKEVKPRDEVGTLAPGALANRTHTHESAVADLHQHVLDAVDLAKAFGSRVESQNRAEKNVGVDGMDAAAQLEEKEEQASKAAVAAAELPSKPAVSPKEIAE